MSDEFTFGGCNPSDCTSCGGGCDSSSGCGTSEEHKTITLTMEDDTEVECAILTIFPVDAKEYIALLPLDENGQNQNGEVYLCFPTSKVTKNTQKLLLLLIQFFRTQRILSKRSTNLK